MRNVRKHVAVVGVIVLFLAVSSVSLAIVAGRDYSRCIINCTNAKAACKAICVDDCKDLCNNVTSCVTPCVDSCKTIFCNDAYNECHDACQSVKNGGSPTEP